MSDHSINPAGERFALPDKGEYAAELTRLEKLATAARAEGKEVVVVMGVGFVGAVMAAIVADTVDKKTGKPSKFVIGCQRPSPRSYWKIPLLNRGESPVKAEDPEVDPMIRRCVLEKKTLIATFNSDCLKLADCVVVDVQCDYSKHDLGNMRTGEAEMAALEATMQTIGEKIQPHCLTLIETTVAPGTTEFVAMADPEEGVRGARHRQRAAARPQLRARHARQASTSPASATSGASAAACNAEARERVVKFLTEVLNTEKFPLTVMDRPIESETTKIVENSYRATILAFLNEWSLFAERNGVDLIKVIKAIKVRPTHSNMIFPGPGIGGYCLPKDGGLGYWAYKHILGFDDGDQVFKMSTTAIDINDTRGLHVAELDARRPAQHGPLHRRRRGAALRRQLPPGRGRHALQRLRGRACASSPRWAPRCASTIPYVEHWCEFEKQDDYPAPGPLAGALLPQPGAA